MNEKTKGATGAPCADCGQKSVALASRAKQNVGATAAHTFDILQSWGIPEDAAARVVELGIRATASSDKVSVLSLALAACAERSKSCEEALDEQELELEKTASEYEELERSYNALAEAFEGYGSSVQVPEKSLDDGEEDDYNDGEAP